MTQEQKQFIEQYSHLIEDNDWDSFFSKGAPIGTSLCLLEAGINFLENISIIKYGMFSYSEIEHLDIPANIEIIKEHAFEGCKKLKSLNIASKQTSISDKSFHNCYMLDDVTIEGKKVMIKNHLNRKTFEY